MLDTVPPAAQRTAACTDLANAERLVAVAGDDLRWVGTWGKGLAWDGARWVLDDTGHWQRAAIRTARVLLDEAATDVDEAKKTENEAALKSAKKNYAWAVTSQGASRIQAMALLSRSAKPLTVSHSQLDADPWLLNVQNGTLDLRTGELQEHRRENLITKLACVDYDPDADAPAWRAFLDRVMAGDEALIEYLQRVVGYALTGSVQEHVMGFFFGGGANGKSTFLSTIHAMLGDYATPAPRGLLFRSRGDRHPTELATLFGRRFVTCSEIEEGQSFDEALTKDLTGGDPIECRRMREDFWSFQPTHKLFLAGNHKPTVRGDDEGIWRRMRLIPWTVTIPAEERDPALPSRLRAELPGVLAWAVRGCMAWQKGGLGAPEAVLKATTSYREENDILGEFFRLYVVFEAQAKIQRKELRESYENFCKENGCEPFGAKRFAGRLRERAVTEGSLRMGDRVLHAWVGVRLATEAEKAIATAWGVTQTPVAVSKSDTENVGNQVATSGYVATEPVQESLGDDDGSLSWFNKREGIQ